MRLVEYSNNMPPIGVKDESTFYYSLSGAPFPVIVMMEQQYGVWSKTIIAPFSGKYLDYDMNCTPDGKRLFFCFRRPVEGKGPPKKDTDSWYVEKQGKWWSEPKHLDYPINSDGQEYYPVFTKTGTMYFSSTREGGKGSGDIYRSRYINGVYTTPENLGDAINSKGGEGDLYIAPDEKVRMMNAPGDGRNEDIYWVDAKIIEELKSNDLIE